MSSLPSYKESPLSDIDKVSFVCLRPICDPADGVKTYERLQARFATHATRSIHYRTYNLKQLAYMIKDNTSLIEQALKADLGKGTFDASLSDVCRKMVAIANRLPKGRTVSLTATDLGNPERDRLGD